MLSSNEGGRAETATVAAVPEGGDGLDLVCQTIKHGKGWFIGEPAAGCMMPDSGFGSGTWVFGEMDPVLKHVLPKSENRMRAMVRGGTAWVISSNMGFSTCCEPGTSRGPGIWATRPGIAGRLSVAPLGHFV